MKQEAERALLLCVYVFPVKTGNGSGGTRRGRADLNVWYRIQHLRPTETSLIPRWTKPAQQAGLTAANVTVRVRVINLSDNGLTA